MIRYCGVLRGAVAVSRTANDYEKCENKPIKCRKLKDFLIYDLTGTIQVWTIPT